MVGENGKKIGKNSGPLRWFPVDCLSADRLQRQPLVPIDIVMMHQGYPCLYCLVSGPPYSQQNWSLKTIIYAAGSSYVRSVHKK